MPDIPQNDPIVRELEGAVAGRYQLERELGRGGMGAVFLARDLRLDRLVAIKVLPPELAVRPELRERFLRETRTAASFSHPNIVPVYEVQETPTLLYFVMAYVEGESLTQRVRRQGPLTVNDAVRLLQEMAWALSYAHGRGVVHRDVKPDNILLERATGRALVTDFGIARSMVASGLTQIGETVGTPHFMSPEQAAGDKVDGRSDLYSLGVVGYFAVTARLPFDAESAQAIMVAHVSQPAVPVERHRPDLPVPLAMVINRCLAKDPAQRFPTGEAIVEALDAIRAQRVEVPPAIRLWTVRADQWFRSGIILVLLMPQIVARFTGNVDQLIFTSLFTVAVLSLWAQIPLGLRELARQGFGFADLRNGIEIVDDERLAVLEATRADPSFARRRRNRLIGIALGIIGSLIVVRLAFNSRIQVGENSYQMRIGWVLALFLAVCVGMACFVFGAAILAGSGRMDRRLHRLWTGRVGVLLWRIGVRRLRDTVTSPGMPTRHGPLTLLETIDGESRRRLGKARVTLERLEGEVERLQRREQELNSAATEAKVSSASLPGSHSERQQALLADLDQARQQVTTRRLAILTALENVRLALVRVKSRLGSVADVEREIGEAASLLAADSPGG